jgi:hypothetical protein
VTLRSKLPRSWCTVQLRSSGSANQHICRKLKHFSPWIDLGSAVAAPPQSDAFEQSQRLPGTGIDLWLRLAAQHSLRLLRRSKVLFRSSLCENSTRYECTLNFEAVVARRAKKRKNSSSARHYDQIRFRFRTAWVNTGSGYHAVSGTSRVAFGLSPRWAVSYSWNGGLKSTLH